jgi:hypothetical protein
MESNIVAHGSPEQYARDLYWQMMGFEELTEDDVRDLCRIILNRLYEAVEEPMKTYYKECLHFINRKGGTR